MFNPHYIARDAVLDICPEPICRRSGQCRERFHDIPCARTHEPADDVRDRISALLEKLVREAPPDYRLDPLDPDFEYKLELRMTELKQALEERERQDDAMALAAV